MLYVDVVNIKEKWLSIWFIPAFGETARMLLREDLGVTYYEEPKQHGCSFFLEEEIDDGKGAFALVIS